MKHKWVFTIDDPAVPSMGKEILGNKGAGLVRMFQLGLPVPPAIIISTKACISYLSKGELPSGLRGELQDGISWIESLSRKKFGNSENQLLVSVRSGAPVSLPGMMSTIKNIGLGKNIVNMGTKEFAKSTYVTFVKESSDVFGISHENGEMILKELNSKSTKAVDKLFTFVPEDVWQQLEMAIKAVFESWNSSRVQKERARSGYPPEMGTACVVQMMVFGNGEKNSGSGVVHTRDPQTGINKLNGDFMLSAQGDAVVSGQIAVKPENWDALYSFPGVAGELERTCRLLEKEYHWAQDVEFTVESNR